MSGADPNLLGDPDGYPLHAACSFARICFINPEKIQALVYHGADVNAKTIEKGMTALHFASLVGLLDVVKFLVENGANVLARDKLGRTALDLCSQEVVVRSYLAQAEHDYRERFMLLAGSIFKGLDPDFYRNMHTGPGRRF
jgi:ankyrin repeat protein